MCFNYMVGGGGGGESLNLKYTLVDICFANNNFKPVGVAGLIEY